MIQNILAGVWGKAEVFGSWFGEVEGMLEREWKRTTKNKYILPSRTSSSDLNYPVRLYFLDSISEKCQPSMTPQWT